MYTSRENNTSTDNHILTFEVQAPKNKMEKHFKLLEKSAEKLSQFEADNLVIHEENSAFNTIHKKLLCNL